MHVHLSETKAEHEQCLERNGLTPAQVLDCHHVFDTRAIAAHCVWVTPEDMRLLAKRGVTAVHCPATLAAGSIVLLLVYPGLISLLGVASFAVWAVVTVGTLLQVYGVKLNLVTILLCVAFCIAGYYAVSGLRDWFLHACYSYDINDVLSGLGDLFG